MLSVNFVESLFQSVMEAQTTLSISPPKNTYKLCLHQAVYRLGFGQSEVARRVRQRQEEKFLKVEALFVQFVAEHNLPFCTGDHFTKLVKQMFPDSNIAKHFHCSCTKTSISGGM